MCGIAGFLEYPLQAKPNARLADAMARLHHRGPDGNGTWLDADAGVGFAHTRLAILDLSEAGAQPMHSRDGRYVLIHNGEIYNHLAIRRELQALEPGLVFRGHSDTETLLEAFRRWGFAATLERCIGMFALALWDRRERILQVARDRLGIKPLYWSDNGGQLCFGSQLCALRAIHPAKPELDPDAVAEFLRLGYVGAPRSIFAGVYKLEPGCMLTASAGKAAVIHRYWSCAAVIESAARARTVDVDAASEELEALLSDAVRLRLLSDVPVGAFLSGGIDSSTVVAMMQAHSTQPVRTFTVGFEGADHDEARHAAAVARHLGTAHTQLDVSPADALALVPELPRTYDEPFADSSQIPTALIARLTRRHVKVALSGDGGDEVFAGYNRYLFAASQLAWLQRTPALLRRLAAAGLRGMSPVQWDRCARFVPGFGAWPQAGDKLYKLAAVLDRLPGDIYPLLLQQACGDIREIAPSVPVPAVIGAPAERMQYLDTIGYLPDDILTKVDRATMAVGLEARVPLLDHRVLEAAWRLPLYAKIRRGVGKQLLRRILYRHVPRQLVQRPKSGFAAPIAAWLRRDLRDWAESLLAPGRLDATGLLDSAAIRTAWAEHQSGRRNRQHELWNVLMFQAWYEHGY